jgi:hypothetical protein
MKRTMDRRTFMGAIAGWVAIAHSDATAQPAAKVQRVGFLSYTTPDQSAPLLREFTNGMRELGYVDAPCGACFPWRRRWRRAG